MFLILEPAIERARALRNYLVILEDHYIAAGNPKRAEEVRILESDAIRIADLLQKWSEET